MYAIRLTNGKEDRGLLVVRHGVAAVYADEKTAQTDAKWLNEMAKRIGSGTVYAPIPFRNKEGWLTETQKVESAHRSRVSTKTSPEARKDAGKASKRSSPESLAGVPAPSIPTDLSELFAGNLATGGTT